MRYLQEKIATAPQVPGVYIWKNAQRQVLYVGKAINLRKRLAYYGKKHSDIDTKTARFLEQAQSVEWIEVRNDLEAILLEMNLIRTLRPKYNLLSKDDKRPLYLHITNDEWPRVRTSRTEIPGRGVFVGPFPTSGQLKGILKRVRRIWPYCSCTTRRRRPCMFVDLGLCGPCPVGRESLGLSSTEEASVRREYRRNIARLKWFLSGNITKVTQKLEQEMKVAASEEEFETAEKIRIQLMAIEELLTTKHAIGEYLSDRSLGGQVGRSQQKALAQFVGLPYIRRIEGYDIANTAGSNPTAAMVVFEGGYPNTSEYRKFRITTVKGPNDPAMIGHTLERRLRHQEWALPELILIDGGKTQVRAAQRAMHAANVAIPLLGLMKRHEELVFPDGKGFRVLSPPLDAPYLTLLRAVRDEAHRFGTTYHKQLREKEMF